MKQVDEVRSRRKKRKKVSIIWAVCCVVALLFGGALIGIGAEFSIPAFIGIGIALFAISIIAFVIFCIVYLKITPMW